MTVALDDGGVADCIESASGTGDYARGFSDVEAGETKALKGAFLFKGAITPNSPDGDEQVLGQGLSDPRWYVGQNTRFGADGGPTPEWDGKAFIRCEGGRLMLSTAYPAELAGYNCRAADGPEPVR